MSAKFLALVNVPGYLGMEDELPEFDHVTDAWEYLTSCRRDDEDQVEEVAEGYSATVNKLEMAARGEFENCDLDPITGLGTIHGETPGGRMHDLGLAYTVIVAEA